MVHLFVTRHSWADEPRSDRPDKDRKLSPMGHGVAIALGKALAKSKGPAPKHILHAPTTRSMQTAALVANTLSSRPRGLAGPDVEVRAEPDPELGSLPDLRTYVQQTIDDSNDGATGENDDAGQPVRNLMILGDAENLDPLIRDVFGDTREGLQHAECRVYELSRDLQTEKPTLVQRWVVHGAGTQAPKALDVM